MRSQITNNKDERVIIEFDDTTRAWNDWKHGNIIQKSSIQERHITSLVESTKIYMIDNNLFENSHRSISIDIPSLIKTKPEINLNCHICCKYQGQLYPCRICGKVYHQYCIKDNHLIKNAINLIGWTCPICEDLRILLSEDELTETNEWIQSLGTHSIFTLDNYINTRMKFQSSDKLNKHMKNVLQTFLNTIADRTSNRLSSIDLLIIDVSLKLLRTSPKLLINSLTSFELYRLSQLFLSLSSTDSQCITYDKFQQIFNNYFPITIPELNSEKQYLHLEALAYSILGHTMEFDRTWSQFLLDSTIPALLGRYNHRTSLDFVNRIVSIKHSTNLSTANLKEDEDDQTLINTVLQKVTQTIKNESKIYENNKTNK